MYASPIPGAPSAGGSLNKKLVTMSLTFGVLFLTANSAWAFSAPSQGAMWYELYEVFYDNLVTGPLGAALVGGVLGWGIMAAVRGSVLTFIICSLAAAVVYNLESVVSGFGMIA